MKRAIVIDEGPRQFALEYDNTLGKKHQMRLDAETYKEALEEARSYLSIGENDLDPAGDQWTVE
jgi:hypothetical protein